MPDEQNALAVGIEVQARGLVRGADLAGPFRLRSESGVVVLEVEDRAGRRDHLRIRTTEAEGIRWQPPHLLLFLRGGDVLELEGDPALALLELQLMESASALGELTRSLQALGSARSPGGSAHDAYYAPLLRARREASGARNVAERLAAFDAPSLRGRYQSVLRELAASRWPDDAAERRALEAELEELFAPVLASLVRLAVAGAEAREAEDESCLLRWRAWSRQVAELFVTADRCWRPIGRTLERPAPPAGGWWRALRSRSVR